MVTRSCPPMLRGLLRLALLGPVPLMVQVGGHPYTLSLRHSDTVADAPGQSPPLFARQRAGQGLDATQADRMLDFLTSISEERHEPELLDAVMSSEGTKLIVGQMNLARRVSMTQYRILLTGLMEGRKPEIMPVDSTARSRNGVVGLLDNAWPLLTWGLAHTEVLKQRVNHLRELDFFERAHAIASRFLPDSMGTPPRVFAVIGGRAGAAKIAPDCLYLDVLVYSYRDRDTTGFPSDAELIRSIGHEMHHMGYSRYLNRKRESLDLGQSESLLFGFLSGLLSEGSATYLISHDRNLAEMYERRSTREYLENHQDLISDSEDVLRAILDGDIRATVECEEATASFLGMWFHSAGSLMLDVIDEAGGLERVMEVVANPGRLPFEYNRAARILIPKRELRLFDDHLAEALIQLIG